MRIIYEITEDCAHKLMAEIKQMINLQKFYCVCAITFPNIKCRGCYIKSFCQLHNGRNIHSILIVPKSNLKIYTKIYIYMLNFHCHEHAANGIHSHRGACMHMHTYACKYLLYSHQSGMLPKVGFFFSQDKDTWPFVFSGRITVAIKILQDKHLNSRNLKKLINTPIVYLTNFL